MIATALLLLTPAPGIEAGEEQAVLRRAQPVVDTFYSAVRRCGARPPFKPTLAVARRDGIIHYDPPTGRVTSAPGR